MTNPTIIADIGTNWSSLNDIYYIITQCANIGVDYIKLQCWNTDRFVAKDHPSYSTIKQYEIPVDWYEPIMYECKRCNIGFMSTPFDVQTARVLKDLGQSIWKVASGDITFYELVTTIARFGDPVIYSTGNSTKDEIIATYDDLYCYTSDITIMHCVSQYPTTLQNSQLKRLTELINTFGVFAKIGLSSHLQYPDALLIAAIAYSMGVNTFEFHVKGIDNLNTPDLNHSLSVSEIQTIINRLRELDYSLYSNYEINYDEQRWMRRNPLTKLRPMEQPCK